MSSPPLISTIVPAYNSARFLSETIDGVLRQTHPRIEIIVVDDGSSADTATVVARFGTKVRYVRQENSGVCAARNRGVRLAQGEYFAFLDADDVWLPHKLECQLPHLSGDARIGCVGCAYYRTDENLHIQGVVTPFPCVLSDCC